MIFNIIEYSVIPSPLNQEKYKNLFSRSATSPWVALLVGQSESFPLTPGGLSNFETVSKVKSAGCVPGCLVKNILKDFKMSIMEFP